MSNFTEKLKVFLHDPIDKCFDIPAHIKRAKNYAEKLSVSGIEEVKGPDQIASCMERSLLPEEIIQNFNELRHPLCKGKLPIENYNKEIIFTALNEVYEKIGEEISNWDDRRKFFYLWRNLQNKIFQDLKNEVWIKYLLLLPADTRVPDHSIWEHLKISSAINAYWDENNKVLYQNNSLFLFTIGPVQNFISQARKTQDFYMGSFILSFLTFKAMEIIIDKYGPTNIIYPDLYRQPLMDWWLKKNGIEPVDFDEHSIELPTIPNRFVVLLPTTDKSEITNLANEMENKIRDTIREVKTSIFDEQEIDIINVKSKINSQLDEFPEIYWVSVPWKIDNKDVSFDDLEDYFEYEVLQKYRDLWDFATNNGEFKPNIGLLYEILYSTLEKSMGVRKNIREFKQVEERGRKCSICGERDVIFFRETTNKNKFIRFNPYAVDLTNNDRVLLKYLADGEGLCAICFIKRTFEIYLEQKVSQVFKNLSFLSTAEIACSDFKEKALKIAKDEFINHQKKLLQERFPTTKQLPRLNIKENLEGYWFYEENLTEKHINEELGIQINETKLKEIRESLKNLTEKVGKPNPYYAILHLDADNMGKWLSGELLPNIENAYNSEVWNNKLSAQFSSGLKNSQPRKILTPAIHASISSVLRNYTLEFVRKIVEEDHLGKLIYAGGDDVLAFVNLKYLFDVMQKLRWAFSGQIKVENGEIKIDINNQTGFVEKDGRYILTMGPEATTSMGIVIAHYKTPLQIVIGKVFEMEKKAKKEGRNRFTICLMKRSGEERIAAAQWKYTNQDTIEILKEITKSFDEDNEKGYIAKSFIQKFASEFKHLKDEKGNFIGTADIIKQELSRLLNRSFNSPNDRKISEDEKRKFIKNLSDKMSELFWDIEGNIDYFINFCTIATFINKRED